MSIYLRLKVRISRFKHFVLEVCFSGLNSSFSCVNGEPMAPFESSQESKESDPTEQNGPLGSGDKFWQPFAGNQITSPPTESLLTGNSQSQPSTSSSEGKLNF